MTSASSVTIRETKNDRGNSTRLATDWTPQGRQKSSVESTDEQLKLIVGQMVEQDREVDTFVTLPVPLLARVSLFTSWGCTKLYRALFGCTKGKWTYLLFRSFSHRKRLTYPLNQFPYKTGYRSYEVSVSYLQGSHVEVDRKAHPPRANSNLVSPVTYSTPWAFFWEKWTTEHILLDFFGVSMT